LKTNETDKFWDRNALYEEVWTTPMQRLAEKYGISDVGLAKVCRKLSIPRPGRGDWARIAAGQIVARTPLPKLSQEIRVWKPMPRKKLPQIEQIANEQERLQLVRLEQLPGEYVLKHGSLSHPLVAQARIVLARATEDDRHILQVREQCLDIRVSKNSLDRALRIMAGLISLIENEGFVVKVGKNSREQTTAVIHEQEIAFGIVEKAERVDAISLPSENILKKVLSYGGTDVAFHPTGQLLEAMAGRSEAMERKKRLFVRRNSASNSCELYPYRIGRKNRKRQRACCRSGTTAQKQGSCQVTSVDQRREGKSRSIASHYRRLDTC
jgi:hypothetical protein